jgi:predicted Zn-dependent protease
MKKVLSVIVLLTAGAIGFAVYWNMTECDREYEKYRDHVSLIDANRLLTSKQYQWEVSQDLQKRQDSLLDVCFDKRHMPIAIEMLEALITELNRPQYLFGRKVRRNSAQVKMVSIYYRKLAEAYAVQGDQGKREQALANAIKYEAEAARMKD